MCDRAALYKSAWCEHSHYESHDYRFCPVASLCHFFNSFTETLVCWLICSLQAVDWTLPKTQLSVTTSELCLCCPEWRLFSREKISWLQNIQSRRFPVKLLLHIKINLELIYLITLILDLYHLDQIVCVESGVKMFQLICDNNNKINMNFCCSAHFQVVNMN